MTKSKAWILVIIAFFIILILAQSISNIESNESKELKDLAIELGLQDVKVTQLNSGSNYKKYFKIGSSNFSGLAYGKMLDIHDELSGYSHDVEIQEYVCNEGVYKCDTYSRIVTLNGKEVYNDYINSKEYQNKLTTQRAEEEKKNRYANQYPTVGMREEYLYYTILGKPDSVEKCKDFYKLQTRARSTTYEWNETGEHSWYNITVHYQINKTHKSDGWEDLPSDNGIVTSIYYKDEKGIVQSESLYGN